MNREWGLPRASTVLIRCGRFSPRHQRHLSRNGILVVEVGNTEDTLLRTFARMPFVWPEIAMGGGGVFLLRAEDLQAAA